MNDAEKNRKKVRVGNLILFSRKNANDLTGIVEVIREATVMIRVTDEVRNFLGIDTHQTVINHKNYKISK